MKKSFLFSLTLLLVSFFVVACDDEDKTPDPTPVTSEAELTAALQHVIDETEIPGFSVAIVKQGNLAFQQSFGFADLDNNQEYTNQTTQAIGSISKTFIGAAVVKAIEDGYFDLETNINDLLPFEIINPKNPTAVIKVKHLVTHTSGLLDNAEVYNARYYILPGENTNAAGAQVLMDLMDIEQRQGIPLEEWIAEYYLPGGDLYSENNFTANNPGQLWNYSNLASSLMAFIIENTSGQAFDEYVDQNIFQALGMNNSSYQSSENTATLYFDKNTPLPLYANDSYPDGSVHTSIEDLSKYMLDMMQGAIGNSQTLFSEAGYELLFRPLLPTGLTPSALGDNQGIFWVRNGSSISHDGGDPGLSTIMQFFDDGETGFILLTNMDASVNDNEENYALAASAILEAVNEFLNAN